MVLWVREKWPRRSGFRAGFGAMGKGRFRGMGGFFLRDGLKNAMRSKPSGH